MPEWCRIPIVYARIPIVHAVINLEITQNLFCPLVVNRNLSLMWHSCIPGHTWNTNMAYLVSSQSNT